MSSIDIFSPHAPAAEMTTQDKDSSPPPTGRRPRLMAPQDAIDDFWARFVSKTPGKGKQAVVLLFVCLSL